MIRSAAKLLRTTTSAAAATIKPSRRFFHDRINGPNASPVALQMIDYALSIAKSQKSDESYGQAMLVLEQCLSSQSSEGLDIVAQNSKGMTLLAMSNLLFARESYDEAMEKLQTVLDLEQSSLGIKVAAMEALVGLNLALGNDDSSSVLADKCLERWGNDEDEDQFVNARAKAVKGLVELLRGNIESAVSLFQGFKDKAGCVGNAALSFGEFLHATACNMSSDEVLLASTCALGQLEAHMGKYNDAEETLTKALSKAEQLFGSHHHNVGVVLTSLALMFRHKAVQEQSSSLLIQEGLYRRALDLLKAPPLDSEGNIRMKISRQDIMALARGGYGEALCVQQNRKNEGEKMKRWAEEAWSNRRFSLAEALKITESSNKFPVIDARIGRIL
ncbi:Tetratricopeptide repeat (TPR)-like superfamily protein [Euphorbia peplus]|nr:Tetratricopeptide repeat (TPR)-like superfamily protein [Euphorbia peplus]